MINKERLESVIKEQEKFIEQVKCVQLLMKLYKHDDVKFKKAISPNFVKLFGFDPYKDADSLWEFCNVVADVMVRNEGGNYPKVIEHKNSRKKSGGYLTWIQGIDITKDPKKSTTVHYKTILQHIKNVKSSST